MGISHPYRIKQKKHIKEETVAKRTPSPDPPLPGNGLDYIIKRPKTKTFIRTVDKHFDSSVFETSKNAAKDFVRRSPLVSAGVRESQERGGCPREDLSAKGNLYMRLYIFQKYRCHDTCPRVRAGKILEGALSAVIRPKVYIFARCSKFMLDAWAQNLWLLVEALQHGADNGRERVLLCVKTMHMQVAQISSRNWRQCMLAALRKMEETKHSNIIFFKTDIKTLKNKWNTPEAKKTAKKLMMKLWWS